MGLVPALGFLAAAQAKCARMQVSIHRQIREATRRFEVRSRAKLFRGPCTGAHGKELGIHRSWRQACHRAQVRRGMAVSFRSGADPIGCALRLRGQIWCDRDSRSVRVRRRLQRGLRGRWRGGGPKGYHYIGRDGHDAGFGNFSAASPFFKGLAHVRLLSGKGFAYIDSKGRKVFEY